MTWLPVGHVAHGYRRVFAIFEDDALRHVVNFAHMPYEQVYRVREMAGGEVVEDPALWWGLSVIRGLVADGTLLGAANPETADDGYIQVRPSLPTPEDLIPLSDYRDAVSANALVLSDERR
ncbi:MAG: hypothetical protein K6T78_10265 [Alicyclobacillus sp.]|nr:hypothetical protein [Alicyclobacillus sp.]